MISFSLALLLKASICFSFSSLNSSEAIVSFDHWVYLPAGSHGIKAAKSAIADQLYFLIGYLNSGSGLGAPKQDAEIPVEKIQLDKDENGNERAFYSYRGTFVLRNQIGSELRLALPYHPDTVFKDSEQRKTTELNPCTDPVFQAEINFWYFWNPLRPGCRLILKENLDFGFIKARVRRLANRAQTFPEYERLLLKDNRIEITLLLGKEKRNPYRSPEAGSGGEDDLNAQSFRRIEKALEEMGFQGRIWSQEEVKKIVPEPLRPFPFVKEFVFSSEQGRAHEISVRLVFANSDLNYSTRGLRYFYKSALENSSVVIYDGHSGFGGSLDLDGIGSEISKEFRPRLHPDSYQIYFFNSCTSYSFYNFEIFKLKSPQNLQIFTAGFETPFEGGEKSDIELIRAIQIWSEKGLRTSYQQLLRKMDSGNLLGLNGD